MDTWFFAKPLNGRFPGGPRGSAEKYVAYFKQMAEAKIPVTINLAMTAEVTADHPIFNPKCTAVMEEVRKAMAADPHSPQLARRSRQAKEGPGSRS